jgi:hypothetical protein
MLENTVRWRREYRPDELDPDYIKPEVKYLPGKSFIFFIFLFYLIAA